MINAFAKVLRYKTCQEFPLWMMSDLRPIVISGPSGAGKSTLIKKLFNEFPDSFGFSVSHTTRKIRHGETEGKQYHFVSVDTMKQRIAEGKFLEHTHFSGNYYGTSLAAVKKVLSENKICILDIDEQGVRNIKDSTMDAIYIFIKPPTMEELRRRLSSRGTETEESLERRMISAKSAITFSEESGVYDFILENKELDEAYKRLKTFLKQTWPNLGSKAIRYDPAMELPLAVSVRKFREATEKASGDSPSITSNGFSDVNLDSSVTEIPLSPKRTNSEQEPPAIVDVNETPLLRMNDVPDFSNASFAKNLPVVMELEEPEAASSDGVCGKQTWCSVS